MKVVVTGGDPPEILEATEHALDEIQHSKEGGGTILTTPGAPSRSAPRSKLVFAIDAGRTNATYGSRGSMSAVGSRTDSTHTSPSAVHDPRRTSGLLAKSSPGAGFTTPCTIIYVCRRTTNTGTLPSVRTSDV